MTKDEKLATYRAEGWLSVSEVCRFCRVSHTTAYRWTKERGGPVRSLKANGTRHFLWLADVVKHVGGRDEAVKLGIIAKGERLKADPA